MKVGCTNLEVLLDGSRGNVPLPHDDAGADQAVLPTANLSVLFTQLTAETRRLLPAVSLFQNVADIRVLAALSHSSGCPARFAGTEPPEWAAALEDASQAGLITSWGAGMWQVDSVVSAYLADQWQAENPVDYEGMRDAATRGLAAACTALGVWLDQQLTSGNAALADQVAGVHQGTLSAMLGYTLEHRIWEEVQAIAGPLNKYWYSHGLSGEADAWAARIRSATKNWTVPASVDTRFSCPIRRESEKWVRHAAHLPRSTRLSR